MSTGIKALGIVGAGAMLALGISASEPVSSVNSVTPPSVAVPINTEAKSVTKPSTAPVPVAKPAPRPVAAETKPASNCHPGYSGCLKMNAGDYDCKGGSGNGPNYTGKVEVYGSDPFGLDRDNDGWGCE